MEKHTSEMCHVSLEAPFVLMLGVGVDGGGRSLLFSFRIGSLCR